MCVLGENASFAIGKAVLNQASECFSRAKSSKTYSVTIMQYRLRRRELIVYVPPDVNPRKVYKELVYPSEISLHGVNSVYLSLRFFTFVHVILSLVHVSSRH